MYRVVNLTSTGNGATTISNHKTIIKTELSNYTTLHNSQVNDSIDENGNPTLSVVGMQEQLR